MSPPRLQIAFCTGRSDPARCALSPVQAAFLANLAAPGRRLVPVNFPYDEATPPWMHTPLLRASLANLREYLASRRLSFAERHRGSVLALLGRAPHTVLLAGSCGGELLANLALDAEALCRVSVFAYGPVARRLPACRLLSVRGQGDWLARWASPPADRIVPGGHMRYLSEPAVLELCRAFIADVERGLP